MPSDQVVAELCEEDTPLLLSDGEGGEVGGGKRRRRVWRVCRHVGEVDLARSPQPQEVVGHGSWVWFEELVGVGGDEGGGRGGGGERQW